jgi:hypothetical protein
MKPQNIILIIALMLLPNLVKSEYFSEISTSMKINFSHKNNSIGDYHFIETAGSGLAWIDYDNDNDIDLILLSHDKQNNIQLFENKQKYFENISNIIESEQNTISMGICTADINQDGWIDFLQTNYGIDYIYINDQGKKFKRHNLDTNETSSQWSTSCAFGDLDMDGDMDLYVTRYVEYDMNGNKDCISISHNGYCNPLAYKGSVDGIYMNDGQGNFQNITLQSGIHLGSDDRGYGVVISDLDNDNDNDIYVANDGTSNRLYINQNNTFIDKGFVSGTAYNQSGAAEASMGIALGDINNDLKNDLFITHFSMETNTLYEANKSGFFIDKTLSYNLANSSLKNMSWGTSILDLNNDGYNDIIIANGHIHDFVADYNSSQTYKQDNQIYLNNHAKKFALLDNQVAFKNVTKKSSRGLATGDFNNDGQLDFAVNNLNDKIDLLKNNGNNNNWIGIKLIGANENTSAIGAVVTIKYADKFLAKEVLSGGSFMSQSDFRLIFGLDKYSSKVEVFVKWPNKTLTKQTIIKLNRYHTIHYKKD